MPRAHDIDVARCQPSDNRQLCVSSNRFEEYAQLAGVVVNTNLVAERNRDQSRTTELEMELAMARREFEQY